MRAVFFFFFAFQLSFVFIVLLNVLYSPIFHIPLPYIFRPHLVYLHHTLLFRVWSQCLCSLWALLKQSFPGSHSFLRHAVANLITPKVKHSLLLSSNLWGYAATVKIEEYCCTNEVMNFDYEVAEDLTILDSLRAWAKECYCHHPPFLLVFQPHSWDQLV